MTLMVAIGGMGAIGLEVARALDAGIEGLQLVAVASRDQARLRGSLGRFRHSPKVTSLSELAEADIVVEALPADLFDEIAHAAVERGRIFVPCSVGALLRRMDLVDKACAAGGRIIVPSGALLGLDAVRAAAEGKIVDISIETRKPPAGLAGAPHLSRNRIDLTGLTVPLRVFSGNAQEAAAGFPANVNVAAALALAGVGPERTRVEIWADPTVTRNIHTIVVDSDAARFRMTIEGVPSESNPRTGKLTPHSVIACLRGLVSTLKVGS